MKTKNKVLPILFLFFIALTCMSQKTQTEVVKSISPEADAKPNNPNVPNVSTQSGAFDRIVVVRLKNKTDLLGGLEEAVEKEQIKNGVILAGIGSTRGYHYHTVSNRDFPSKNYYMKDPTRPMDISGMNGYIIDGRLHPHITFADDEGALGGHLEPETYVFTFAIVTIGVFSDAISLDRADDKTLR